MVVRGRLAFDDQGRLVEIAEDAADPNNPDPSEIDPVEFEDLIAQTASVGSLVDEADGSPWETLREMGFETGDVVPLLNASGTQQSTTTSSTTYTSLPSNNEIAPLPTEQLINQLGQSKVKIRIIGRIYVDTNGETVYIRARQHPTTEVSSTSVGAGQTVDSGWHDIAVAGNYDAVGQGRVSGGTGTYLHQLWNIFVGVEI